MRYGSLICLFSLASAFADAQNRPGFELSASRMDQQADYPDHDGKVAYTDLLHLALHRTSLSFGYKLPLAKHLSFKAGLGYTMLRADGIKHTYTFPTVVTTNSRPIEAPNAIQMPESTDAYQYQGLALDLAIDRSFALSRIFTMDAAIQYDFAWTFRQTYHLKAGQDSSLVHHDQRVLGHFISLSAAVLGKFGKFSTGPQLILPLMTGLYGDARLDENTHRLIHFWVHGVGLEWRICYLIK